METFNDLKITKLYVTDTYTQFLYKGEKLLLGANIYRVDADPKAMVVVAKVANGSELVHTATAISLRNYRNIAKSHNPYRAHIYQVRIMKVMGF